MVYNSSGEPHGTIMQVVQSERFVPQRTTFFILIRMRRKFKLQLKALFQLFSKIFEILIVIAWLARLTLQVKHLLKGSNKVD